MESPMTVLYIFLVPRSDHGSLLGCKGVDANRNWGFHWAEGGSSSNKCSDTYHGPEAFSEIENRHARDYLAARKGKFIMYNIIYMYNIMYIIYIYSIMYMYNIIYMYNIMYRQVHHVQQRPQLLAAHPPALGVE